MIKFIALTLTFSIWGCVNKPPKATELYSRRPASVTVEQVKAESVKANKLFDKIVDEELMLEPMYQTYLGSKIGYDQLGDFTEAHFQKKIKLSAKHEKEVDRLNFEALDTQTRLSYLIVKKQFAEEKQSWKWRHHTYAYTSNGGMHTEFPSFMMNMHQVKSESDLKDYISRLSQVKRMFSEITAEAKKAEAKGILPPSYVYPKVIGASEAVLAGRPFTPSKKDSPLFTDFKTKLKSLKLNGKKMKQYMRSGEAALLTSVKPGYSKFVSFLKRQQKKAKTINGVWALPSGAEYYKQRLAHHTTIKGVTPKLVHDTGLREVARIHTEIKGVMKKVGFKGSIQKFFKYTSEDKKFFYRSNSKGKQAYLQKSRKYVDSITAKLDNIFITKPKRALDIKAVEKFREEGSGTAFYMSPPLKGDRPGIYYVNFKDMEALPKWEMQALVHHEAIPGHHMQLAIQADLGDLPKVRRLSHFSAYVEGWGLYAERIPKEMGFYKDPYSDFGRLAMELMRATRLVVDTGVHAKKWSFNKAVAYLDENLPGSHKEHSRHIERYMAWPGQATAYKMGMNKILELRENAKSSLGKKFDIRKFHDTILTNGPMPLDLLTLVIDDYVNKSKRTSLEKI